MNIENKLLAINGGEPVSKEPIVIHKPYFNEDDFSAVYKAMRSTFVLFGGPNFHEYEKRLSEYSDV